MVFWPAIGWLYWYKTHRYGEPSEFIGKNPGIIGPMKFKSVFFNNQLYWQLKIGNLKNSTVYKSNSTYIIFRDKFNQKYKGFICWNLQNLMTKVEELLNKWQDVPCSWIGRLSIFKMSNFPQIDKKISCNSNQNLRKTFCRNQETDSKIYMGRQRM